MEIFYTSEQSLDYSAVGIWLQSLFENLFRVSGSFYNISYLDLRSLPIDRYSGFARTSGLVFGGMS